jgi:hypothetical protein
LFRASRNWRTFARVAGLRDMPGSRPATAFTLFAVRRAAVLVWGFFFALGAIITTSPSWAGGAAPAGRLVGRWTALCPTSAAAALRSADVGENSYGRKPFRGG